MRRKYFIQVIIAIVGVGLLFSAYVIDNQEKFGICDRPYAYDSYIGCLDSIDLNAEILGIIGIFLLFIFPFSFFVEARVLKKWGIISAIFLPISLLIIMNSSDYTGFYVGPSAQQIWIFLLGGIYFVGTMLFVVYGIFKKRKRYQNL